MNAPPSPPAATDELLQHYLGPEEPLGLALLPLGTGPVPIPGAERGALALNRNGDVVLVVLLDGFRKGSASAIADELDRIARLGPDDLLHLGGTPITDLDAARRSRFGDASEELNREQRAVLITRRTMSESEWKDIVIELGRRLEAVYSIGEEDAVAPLEPPLALQRAKPTATRAGWTTGNWIALAAILLGVGIALLGIARVLLARDDPRPQAVPSQTPVHLMAAGSPSDASHTNWIGQRRAAMTTKGKIIFLYWSGSGLQLVTDQGNRGKSWRSPITVSEEMPTSFSTVIDAKDNLHVALLSEDRPMFMSLRQTSSGWEADAPLSLSDSTTSSSVIDLAWDERQKAAHVIWIEQDDAGQKLMWAMVEPDRNGATVMDETTLLETSGLGIPMLANVASGPGSVALVTYRRGDEGTGWFSQLGTYDDATGMSWQPQESVPVEGGVGAASLEVDPTGTAHLLLRNDAGPRIEYFKRSPRSGWSTPEVVVEGDTIDEVDFPTLAVDVSSQLVYAVFQTDRGSRFGNLQAFERDPAQGWQGPYSAATESDLPNGAMFPTTLGLTMGAPSIFFTSGGDAPALQSVTLSPL